VLVLMEKLSPTERAAYVLREAFDYPYRQIAQVLRLSEANTRQLVARARKHIADQRRVPVSPVEQRRLLGAFIDAAQRGDRAALEALLAADVVSCSDGGGLVRAARTPVVGRALGRGPCPRERAKSVLILWARRAGSGARSRSCHKRRLCVRSWLVHGTHRHRGMLGRRAKGAITKGGNHEDCGHRGKRTHRVESREE